MDNSTDGLKPFKNDIRGHSIKKLQFMFILCAGVVFVFMSTGLRSIGANEKRGNVNTRNNLIFKSENEKTENERARDQIFLQYATSVKFMNELDSYKKTSRLPDVIGIGAEKCGTGALRSLLGSHPMIQVTDKEPHFFDRLRYNRGIGFYKTFLPKVSPHELLFEKTPAYFNWNSSIPNLIKKDVPDAKIILVLCDPTARVFSDYEQEVALGHASRAAGFDFLTESLLAHYSYQLNKRMDKDDEQIEYIAAMFKDYTTSHVLTTGLYYYHLLRWYKVYNRSEIHIIDGEELINNPGKVIKELQTFLRIPEFIISEDLTRSDTGFYCFSHPVVTSQDEKVVVSKTKPHCMSRSKGRTRMGKSGKPRDISITKLRRFYAPYNQKLYKLLGRKFNW
ncbi:heparan sulfate glucosamine 3-O-sulfotransferase 1-like [Styela clava]